MRRPQGASFASVKSFRGFIEIGMTLAMSVLPFLIANCLFEYLNDVCGHIHQSMVLQGAWTRQIDGKLTDNAAWSRSEHQHTVTERDRLADIVRDKEDSSADGRTVGFEISME